MATFPIIHPLPDAKAIYNSHWETADLLISAREKALVASRNRWRRLALLWLACYAITSALLWYR